MAVCAAVVLGSLVPTPTALGSCTDFVLFTAADYAAMSPILSVSDVLELSGAVVAVWAVAWGLKILRRTL